MFPFCNLAAFPLISSLIRGNELDPFQTNIEQSISMEYFGGSMAQLVVDRQALLGSLENDNELVKEVVGLFLADSPAMLLAIRTAVTAGDSHELMKSAHALKGSVGVFGAKSAVAAAQALEAMGKSGQMAGSVEALAGLEREMALVTFALQEIAKASD
jgi:HPt (histidine-containing phosphotransfer) domain-containing protein